MSLFRRSARDPLPGFGLGLGITLSWLSLIVLLPLVALVLRAAQMGPSAWWAVASEPRVVAAMKLSFGAALIAAAIASVLGTLVAWTLVRYRFPARRFFDALVDVPFALPTAVAGIALTALYSANGWLGRHLEGIGIEVAQRPLGIVLALVFIGLPFAVRTVQPILEDQGAEEEEAAATLGASRLQVLWRVVFPPLRPAILTGFALAFARGVGEFGSVIFIAGNIPYVSEIAPLLILIRLEEFDYAGATAIASLMLLASFALLLIINSLQGRLERDRHR